jgi:hypothetical protein
MTATAGSIREYTATLPTITATELAPPPAWALLQRQLIEVMERAADLYVEKYCASDMMTYYVQDVDDIYEITHNWGLLYALGGDERVLRYALEFWNSTTRYYEDGFSATDRGLRHPFYMAQLHNEYWNLAIPYNSDWFHMGEGSQSFYDFGIADPSIEDNKRRAERFAGLYIGDDPSAPNYDSEYKIIRSPYHGSEGPLLNVTGRPPLLHSTGKTTGDLELVKAWLDHENYGGYFHRSVVRDWERWSQAGIESVGIDRDHLLYPHIKNLEANWWVDKKRRAEVTEKFDKMALQNDVPENLGATAMVTNAFLYTGDERYKQWVLEYTEAWMDRIRKNGGILPDNIGPTGKIGEHRDGQWWGSIKGWTSSGGIGRMLIPLAIASENAHLLTGDKSYLELLRSQVQMLLERSVTKDDGQLTVPYRHDMNGWSDYGRLDIYEIAHLFHASMEQQDFDIIARLRDGDVESDWNDVESQRDRRSGQTEYARFQYYDGKNPDWPMKVLEAEYRYVMAMHDSMRRDDRNIEKIIDDNHYPPYNPNYPSRRDYGCEAANPLVLKGLTQVMTGAPQNVYNGGLQRGTVRYFDITPTLTLPREGGEDKNGRPGLPLDVAALVDSLSSDSVGIQLVNTGGTESRRLIVQSGVFGEHEFTTVHVTQSPDTSAMRDPQGWMRASRESTKQVVTVNGTHFAVTLPPFTSIRIECGLRRFVNTPSYAQPGG